MGDSVLSDRLIIPPSPEYQYHSDWRYQLFIVTNATNTNYSISTYLRCTSEERYK